MTPRTAPAILLAVAVLISFGCTKQQMGGGGQHACYERLGGKTAITAVVDDFVGRVAADRQINVRFANSNVARLKARLVEQICQASGGPCTYTGPDMKVAHTGMGIMNSEFDALVEDLVASLDKFNVGEREKKGLLGLLGLMPPEIVTGA